MNTSRALSFMNVAVVAYPNRRCINEFDALADAPGVHLAWAYAPPDCWRVDWIVLPGTASVSADLAWLRAQGLDRAIAEHALKGGAVLGICEGLQMLCEGLVDTAHIEGNAPGLGLLPLVTAVSAAAGRVAVTARFNELIGPWSALSGVTMSGEAMPDRPTAQHPAMAVAGQVAREALPEGLGWTSPSGHVLGVYLHGLFRNTQALTALLDEAAKARAGR